MMAMTMMMLNRLALPRLPLFSFYEVPAGISPFVAAILKRGRIRIRRL
jgi:hypothetical protein